LFYREGKITVINMVEIKKINFEEIRCPYCNDFWDLIDPDTFFWDGDTSRNCRCFSADCGKLFIVEK